MERHLIIGGSHPTAVGNSLRFAAAQRGLCHRWLDFDAATAAPRILRSLYWRLLGKRPPRLTGFNRQVVADCVKNKCHWVHCAGNIPLQAATLRHLRSIGVSTSIWLTDDPWNSAQQSRWVMEALPNYDVIFTPRQSNIDQLRAIGTGRVLYLPFGYDPRYFHPVPGTEQVNDLFFAGGADSERVHFMEPLINANLDIALYGAYWDRFPSTAAVFRGYGTPQNLSTHIAQARLAICLVRRANRDGHCMRTFELAAAGACMLTEDTHEHRSIFGKDGEATFYFHDSEHAIAISRELLASPEKRIQLRDASLRLITDGRHTYGDRLATILAACARPPLI